MSLRRKPAPMRRRPSVKDLPITKGELCNILDEHHYGRFHIDRFSGANRLVESLIAHYELGASKERIYQFVEHYTTLLLVADPLPKPDEQFDLTSLKGSKSQYRLLRCYFRRLLENVHADDFGALIRNELPKLTMGIISPSPYSAFHALENLGYARSINKGDLVADGLAYLYYSYNPMHLRNRNLTGGSLTKKRPSIDASQGNKAEDEMPSMSSLHISDSSSSMCSTAGSVGDGSGTNLVGMANANTSTRFGKGKLSFIEALERIGSDVELDHAMKSSKNMGSSSYFKGTPFEFLLQKKGDVLLDFAYKVRIPAEYQKSPELSMDWITDQMITVYQSSLDRNCLHFIQGVTSSWALRQLLPDLADNLVAQRELVKVHVCGLFADYIVHGHPKFNSALLTESPSASASLPSWSTLKELALTQPLCTDEHVLKLVHVCHERSGVNIHASMDDIYKRACLTAIQMNRFHRQKL